MALNGDQQQLVDWYNQGYGSVALRHGFSVEIMQEWLQDQGYYDTEQGSELAERMLGELQAEIIGYEINCLDPLSAAVWLLLLTDKDKDQGNAAEQINTVCFDIVYHVIDLDLVKVDGTGLHRVSMTIVDDTDLDQADVIDYIDQRVADLSEHERELLELLSSPQKQPRSYYYGLIDLYRALD
ncbi:hypothetical protein P5Z58_02485 [Limosilactobacillus mucosae]|nr:hypothetical protein [Limosilactobacillus mucosae]